MRYFSFPFLKIIETVEMFGVDGMLIRGNLSNNEISQLKYNYKFEEIGKKSIKMHD